MSQSHTGFLQAGNEAAVLLGWPACQLVAYPTLRTPEEPLSFLLKLHHGGALSRCLLSLLRLPHLLKGKMWLTLTGSCGPAFVNVKTGSLALQSHALGNGFPREHVSHS